MTPFDPVRLLEVLLRHGVDLVVIGGLGATLHGAELATGDVDIIYSPGAENLGRLAAALLELEADSVAFPGLETDDLPLLLSGSDLWRWRTNRGDLDMMVAASGAPPFPQLKAACVDVPLGDLTVPTASLDHLIAVKQSTARKKDIDKLRELTDLREATRARGA